MYLFFKKSETFGDHDLRSLFLSANSNSSIPMNFRIIYYEDKNQQQQLIIKKVFLGFCFVFLFRKIELNCNEIRVVTSTTKL